MEELLELSTDTVFDASQQSMLAETAHRTNVITVVLMVLVILTNIVAIVLLAISYKQSKRPKEVGERYKDYKRTVGNVVSVEKVAYYIKRYVKKEDDAIEKPKKDELALKIDKNAPSPVEKHTGNEVVYKTPEKLAEEQEALEIRKFRYRVFYEFTVQESGSLYTGECYVYEPGIINPGDIIEVVYDPSDPMRNFTDQNMPAGYLTN